MNIPSLRLATLFFTVLLPAPLPGLAQSAPTGPANATILIVRHAEKPETGTGLSDAGRQRANAYPEFFRRFEIDSKPAQLNFLIATKDSDNSERPRLTLEPLSAALHLPIEADFKNKAFGDLAAKLKGSQYNGKAILICWHHGHIPSFLVTMGADPARLLPNGVWPENVFGWLVQLRYNKEGHLKDSTVINEKLMPGDANLPPPNPGAN